MCLGWKQITLVVFPSMAVSSFHPHLWLQQNFFLCHWLFQNHRQEKKPTPNPMASLAFLWITSFEYCKEHTQEEEEGVRAVGGGGLYKVGVISVAGPLETPSSSVCSPLPVLPSFQGYGGHFLASSGAGLGVELFSSAFYKLCVCSKCRNSSKIFCSVLTWSPFEVDKYQLFKQKIK